MSTFLSKAAGIPEPPDAGSFIIPIAFSPGWSRLYPSGPLLDLDKRGGRNALPRLKVLLGGLGAVPLIAKISSPHLGGPGH